MIRNRMPRSREAVAAHYDHLDVFYRELWGEHLHHGLWLSGNETPEQAVRKLVHKVVELAGIRPGWRVCDVGCGYGATARMLVQELGADVDAFTISRVQYDYAQSHVQEGSKGTVNYCFQDWLENDLPDSSFDAVIAIECLSHIEDKAAFFEQVFRVLRPGGRSVICAWLMQCPELRLRSRGCRGRS